MDNISSTDKNEKIINHLKNIFGIIKTYFKCSLIDSLIIGVANFVFMFVMSMPHSILISIIAGITNIIPNVGPVIGAAIGGVILMFYDTKLALCFLAFTVILQILDGLIIKPKLFGESFGISGIWMFIAMLVGGGVFGVVGMILVVPVVAIVQYLYKNVYLQYKKR
ncbi:MAG: AI-2E family transporter [Butyrivibrio sp.]|uniref:AI-2E family transporter n=1 Tax=Butyrivibrio sp. TaxID=28121 RepID=UPI0025F9F942|nr:AI-2E family transporter [Butyrivibrio sp.]MCR5771741.1 AI-2E family transporter [Butyrivibrio sp.]